MATRSTAAEGQTLERRVLVIADETCINANLCQLVAEHVDGAESEVLVVAPALNTRLRHTLSDSDEAERRAKRVLDETLGCMRRQGVTAQGELGDADPLMAISDWLGEFPADEIIIATHPTDQLNWLERGVVEEARRRFDLPVTHAVVQAPSHAPGASVP